MPYTPAHAIVALPVSYIAQRHIPLASIMVGCVSPDFPYLLALTTTNAPGHSIIGVLIYCLLPSLFVLFIWYRWLEHAILDLLKLPYERRPSGPNLYQLMTLGVLIGAYSHVFWDATSHSDGALVIGSAFWQREYYALPLYKWNQYGSGILGSIALALWYLCSLSSGRRELYQGHWRLGLVSFSTCIVFFVILANIVHGPSTFAELIVRSAVGTLTGSCVGACLYTAIVTLYLKKNS